MLPNIGKINNYDGGVINIHYPEHKIPKQLTIKLGKDTIIGREKELKEIAELLNNSNSLLLINGIGGIGKSTIASYYLHSQKEKLDYYGFFEGIDSFLTELRSRLDIKAEKEDEAFMEALTKLSALKGEKLLVIDDVKNIEENQDKIDKILALENSGYKILLTSREEIEDITRYELDVLSMDDAKKLFNSIYEVEDEALLEEILEYLDYHAFFVEMTSKTLKSKKTLTSKIIKEKFENGEFSTITRKRKESFNDYLNELFSFDELDDEEILMLKQLSILPSIEIEFDFLLKIFDRENDEDFEELLNYLCEKGWLNSFENGYKLHQIVKEYIWIAHLPSFEDIQSLFDIICEWIKDSADIQIAVNYKNNIEYIVSLYQFLKKINFKSEKIANFFLNLGNIYHYSGHFKQAQPLYEESSKIYENIFGNNHLITAISYNNLAQNYKLLEQYDEARTYHYQALKIRKSILEENHLDIAESYHNLAGISISADKSEEFFLKALKIRKDGLEEEHPILASSYNGLGELYRHEKRYKKSLFFHRQALKIRVQKLGETHPHTVLSYHNLASTFHSLGKFKKAEKLFKKGLAINMEKRNKDFYGIHIFKENLAINEQNDNRVCMIDELEMSMSNANFLLTKDTDTLFNDKYNKREKFKNKNF